MSIIVLASSSSASRERADRAPLIDPGLRELLDHIAVELAEEYVRLMEAAAKAEESAPSGPR